MYFYNKLIWRRRREHRSLKIWSNLYHFNLSKISLVVFFLWRDYIWLAGRVWDTSRHYSRDVSQMLWCIAGMRSRCTTVPKASRPASDQFRQSFMTHHCSRTQTQHARQREYVLSFDLSLSLSRSVCVVCVCMCQKVKWRIHHLDGKKEHKVRRAEGKCCT